jgi:hypothetical protein
MEELKRPLKRELLGDLKPILEAQRIQLPDIEWVMSEEERRSSFDSIAPAPITIQPMLDQVLARGGRPQRERMGPEILASPPLHSSLELDTIDNLAQPTTCNLVLMIRGSFQMEVRRGLVYPHQTMLDDI